jgi:hypothetical protein
MDAIETNGAMGQAGMREINWGIQERPVRPALDFLTDQGIALVSLPLYQHGEPGAHPYTIIVTPDRRLCIPSSELSMRVTGLPLFIDSVSRWRETELRLFLESRYTPPGTAELFAQLVAVFDKYLDLASPTEAKLLSAWTMASYWTGLWQSCAYLKAEGQKASGKSRLLTVLSQLVWNPALTSNCSMPALVRLTNSGTTCLVDEQENLSASSYRELRLVLQAGYRQAGGDVVRCVGRRLVRYSVFGMKAIASILPLPADGALASRCIVLKMFPSSNTAKTALKLGESSEDWASLRAALYATSLLRWKDVLAAQVPALPGMAPRTAEIYSNLFQIAQFIDPSGSLTAELAAYAARSKAPTVEALSLTGEEKKVVTALAGMPNDGQEHWLTSTQIKQAIIARFPELMTLTTSELGLILVKHKLWAERRHTPEGKVYRLDIARAAALNNLP